MLKEGLDDVRASMTNGGILALLLRLTVNFFLLF